MKHILKSRSLHLLLGLIVVLKTVGIVLGQNGPSCPGDCYGPGGTMDVAGVIIVSSNSYYSGATIKNNKKLIIKKPATLFVGAVGNEASTPTVDFQNGAEVMIEEGATLIVNGKLTNSNGSTRITVHGSIIVFGNAFLGNNSEIRGSGTFAATGTISGAGTAFNKTYNCMSGPCLAGFTIPNSIYGQQNFCFPTQAQALTGNTVPEATYQWAQSSNSISGFKNIVGATFKDYTPGTISSTTYYLRYTNTVVGSIISNIVAIKIGPAPLAISSHPNSTTICGGSPATFSVVATGASVNYKWQEDKGNGIFTDIPSAGSIYTGINSPTLSISDVSGKDNYKFRVIVSSICGTPASLTSNTATLTVQAPPFATISYTGSPFCSSTNNDQPVSHTGTPGGVYASVPQGLAVNASSGAINPSLSTPGVYTVIYTIPATGVCASRIFNTTAKVNKTGQWLGSVNSNWSNASNWSCNIIPSSTTDVMIPVTPNNPAIMSPAIAGNIIISPGAELSIKGYNTLKIYGNWNDKGNFIAANSTVEFNGTTPQIITSNTKESFYNLTVNKPSGSLTLDTDINILANGTLKLKAGVLDANLKTITLKSAAPYKGKDSTARLAKVEVGASLINASKFSVERFIPIHEAYTTASGSKVTYRITFLAPAVSGVTAADFADDIKLTGGPAGTGFQAPNSLKTSTLCFYNETWTSTSGRDGGWKYVMASNTSMPSGNGYRAYCGHGGTDEILKVTGQPIIGTFTKTITYTPAGTQGWNLIGNPYACEIDFDAFYEANKQYIEPSLYILDPANGSTSAPNSSYFTYLPLAGMVIDPRATPRPSSSVRYIASSQAFFVKARTNAGTGVNLIFTEAMKVSGVPVYGNFRKESVDMVRINITDGKLADQAIVYFNDAATTDFDHELDAKRIDDGTLSITTGNNAIAINSVPNEHGKMMVPITLTTHASGSYKFNIVQNENGSGEHFYIFDKQHHKYFTVAEGLEHHIDLVSGVNANRFFLTNAQTSITTGFDESTETHDHHLGLYPNPYHRGSLYLNLDLDFQNDTHIEILDGSGMIIKDFHMQGMHQGKHVKFDLSHMTEELISGQYVVRAICGDEFEQEKLVVVK